MTSEKIEGSQFGWGDVVQIASTAPSRLRPGEYGSVCGGVRLSNEEMARAHGEPLGTLLLTVEYSDGSAADIPERYFTAVENDQP